MSEHRILRGGTPHRLYRQQYTVFLVVCLALFSIGALTGALFGWLRWTEAAEAIIVGISLLLAFYGCHRWLAR